MLGFISTVPEPFGMIFYIAFSENKFYGAIGIEETRTSQKIFSPQHTRERMKMSLDETGPLIIVLDNDSISKIKDEIKFITDSYFLFITIPLYDPSLNPVYNFI